MHQRSFHKYSLSILLDKETKGYKRETKQTFSPIIRHNKKLVLKQFHKTTIMRQNKTYLSAITLLISVFIKLL